MDSNIKKQNSLGKKWKNGFHNYGNRYFSAMNRFISLDKNSMANILQETLEWKINTACCLYFSIYSDDSNQQNTKIFCASYILSHNRIELGLLEFLDDDCPATVMFTFIETVDLLLNIP